MTGKSSVLANAHDRNVLVQSAQWGTHSGPSLREYY